MDEKAKNVARRLCIDLDLDLKALERDFEEFEAYEAELERLTPEQKANLEARFQKFLAKMGVVYHEEDDTFEFITKQ